MTFQDIIHIFKNNLKNLILINMASIEFIFYFIIVTIGYLLGIYVTYKKVLITHGPNSNKIKEIKYNHNGKCYMFKPKIRKC